MISRSVRCINDHRRWVRITSNPDGKGNWEVASDDGVRHGQVPERRVRKAAMLTRFEQLVLQ
jgi:hypothetical protein